MILVCDRSSEQREDAVAGGLHDVAVVATGRVDHELQRRVDNRARLLRIEVLHQLGRALDVGEHRRDHLALAVDWFGRGAFGGDYDLRFSRRNGRGGGGFSSPNCSPTFFAVSRPRTHRYFARWANQLQPRSAFLAERGIGGAFVVAAWAAHRASCGPEYYHTPRGRRKEQGAPRASRGVVVDQRCSVARPSHFVPAWQPYPGGVCHPVTCR